MNTTKDALNSSSPNILITGAGKSSAVLTISLLCLSAWISVTNALVFVLTIIRRREIKTLINIQILSVSLTDTIIGIAVIPVALSYQIRESFTSYETCAFFFANYTVPQVAAMYHAFGICVHRLMCVMNTQNRPPRRRFHLVMGQIAIIWLLSFIASIIPFVVYGQTGETLPGCSFNTLFGDHYGKAFGYLAVICFCPHVGINIVYVYMLLFLKRLWNSIGIRTNPKTAETHISAITESTNQQRTETVQCRTSVRPPREAGGMTLIGANMGTPGLGPKIPAAVAGPADRIKPVSYSKPPTGPTSNSGAERQYEESTFISSRHQLRIGKGNRVKPGDNLKIQQQCENKEDNQDQYKHFLSVPGTSTSPHKIPKFNSAQNEHKKKRENIMTRRPLQQIRSKRGQREMFITVGILLLLINICMTPLNFLLIFEAISDGILTRRAKFLLLGISLLNSALNPIVYVIRIKPFRAAVVETCRRILKKITGRR